MAVVHHHNLPPARYVSLLPELREHCEVVLRDFNPDVERGEAWTTDAPQSLCEGTLGGVMAAFFHPLAGGDLFSEAAEAIDNQVSRMARPPRLERGTLCLEGRCSIQLSYGRRPINTCISSPVKNPN